MVPFFRNGGFDGDGVADVDGADEADAVIAVGKGDGVDDVGGHADGDAENERAVGNAPFEFLGFNPFLVHVVREKVAGLPGVQHDVSFGDGTAECLAACANFIFFKVSCLYHYLTPLFV